MSTISEETIRSVFVRSVPLLPETRRDWSDVLARSELAGRAVRTRRLVLATAIGAAIVTVVTATPLGAAIARGFGNFSDWLSGKPGQPVSSTERRALEHPGPYSWALFPKGAKVRRLIVTKLDGVQYRLYGYRTGDMFCLRLATSPALLAQTTCAPRSDLASKREPVLPLYVDAPVVSQKRAGGWLVPVKKSSVTFGIVSDGVSGVRGRTRSRDLAGIVASDSFLIVNPGGGGRVRSVSASDAAGDAIAIPIAGPPKTPGDISDNGALMNKLPSGPAFRMAKRQVTGVKIGWLARREPRGAVVPPRFPEMESGTTFQRLLAPEPGALRIDVSLHRNGYICMGFVSPQSESEDGYGCMTKERLTWGGGGDPSMGTAHFLWREAVGLTEGDQYVTNAGLVDDRVSRMMLLLVSGKRVPVTVKDNAFVYMVPRTEYPVLLLAYNSRGRIVGFERDAGRYNSFSSERLMPTKVPPKTVSPPRGKPRAFPRDRPLRVRPWAFLRVRTIPGGVVTESQPLPLVFLQSELIRESTQAGQSFYDAVILVKNRSNKTAVDVRSTLNIRPKGNNGMSGLSGARIATILPHSENLLVYPYYGVPLVSPKGSRIDVEIDPFHTRRAAPSPLSFSQLHYRRSSGSRCTISGVVSNRFTKQRKELQLNVAGFVNGRLVSGGSTSLRTVFPGRDAAFKVEFFKSATCPEKLDRIGVYPNLSTDEIYNP